MFLTPDEISELTGYKQRSRQITWLRRYGIRVYVTRVGEPRVLRSDLEAKPKKAQKPDLDAVRELS